MQDSDGQCPARSRTTRRRRELSLVPEVLCRPPEVVLPCVEQVAACPELRFVPLPDLTSDFHDSSGTAKVAEGIEHKGRQILLGEHGEELITASQVFAVVPRKQNRHRGRTASRGPPSTCRSDQLQPLVDPHPSQT